MDKEQVGRSPLRGSGHSAEPEPVPVSAASAASTPNAWRPIKTMPWQTVCEVRNPQMQEPVLASRGYSHDGMVHPDNTFCTSVYTPHRFFPTPAGRLVCPTEWRLPVLEEGQS